MSKTPVVVLLATWLTLPCEAQVNDFGIWTSFSLRKSVTRSLSVGLSQDIRFYENASEISSLYSDLSVGYEVLKPLKVELHYRYIRKKQVDDFYETRNRWYADVSYRYRFRPVSITLRERFQSQHRPARSDQKTQSPEYHLRSKVTAKADLDKKYFPFVSFEWYYPLNRYNGNETDNLRYAAGVEYEVNKIHSIDLYYLINKEMFVNNPQTDYVVGVDYRYSF